MTKSVAKIARKRGFKVIKVKLAKAKPKDFVGLPFKDATPEVDIPHITGKVVKNAFFDHSAYGYPFVRIHFTDGSHFDVEGDEIKGALSWDFQPNYKPPES